MGDAIFGMHRSIDSKWYIIHGYRGSTIIELEKAPTI